MNEQALFKGVGTESYKGSGGLSSQERQVLKEQGKTSFEQQKEKLMEGAKIVVKNHEFVQLVTALLKKHGDDLNNLTEDVCQTFLDRNPDLPYDEPGMVYDVAAIIAKRKSSLN